MRLHNGVYGHRKRICTESWQWEKNPLPHRGIEPAWAACRSDALPTELHPQRGTTTYTITPSIGHVTELKCLNGTFSSCLRLIFNQRRYILCTVFDNRLRYNCSSVAESEAPISKAGNCFSFSHYKTFFVTFSAFWFFFLSERRQSTLFLSCLPDLKKKKKAFWLTFCVFLILFIWCLFSFTVIILSGIYHLQKLGRFPGGE